MRIKIIDDLLIFLSVRCVELQDKTLEKDKIIIWIKE